MAELSRARVHPVRASAACNASGAPPQDRVEGEGQQRVGISDCRHCFTVDLAAYWKVKRGEAMGPVTGAG